MKTLVFKSDRFESGFEELLGHGCTDDAELEAYAAMSPNTFKVVDAPYDPGEFIPPENRPYVDPMPKLTAKVAAMSEEEKAAFAKNVLGPVIAALKDTNF